MAREIVTTTLVELDCCVNDTATRDVASMSHSLGLSYEIFGGTIYYGDVKRGCPVPYWSKILSRSLEEIRLGYLW